MPKKPNQPNKQTEKRKVVFDDIVVFFWSLKREAGSFGGETETTVSHEMKE